MRYQQLIETKNILYHGDNVGTTDLHAKWMMHGESNNQEGIGIYFTPSIKAAQTYGKKVSSIDITGLNIKDSRGLVADIIPARDAIMLLRYLHQQDKTNDDGMWYMMTDYGIQASEPTEVEDHHFSELHHAMKMSQIRNWQIELAQASDAVSFVTGWNKYIGIDGIYEVESKFYAIINTNITSTPVNF
jgi:hypothetical protein